MPKLPNSLRGPGGETRPSGKGDHVHGVGILFLILSFLAAYILSLLWSWSYYSNLVKGPDPWGMATIGVIMACLWSLIGFPILTALTIAVSRLVPGIGKSMTGFGISLVIAALATPVATHGFLWVMMLLKGQ